jgi:hypothetical protein
MKNISFAILAFITFSILLSSCKKDEGKLPTISFKTGTGYTSASGNVASGTTILMGINAAKSEDKDVLKHINISKSVNGAAATSLFDTDLSGTDGDNYTHDISAVVGTTVGEKDTYTFTVTNRDGLTNAVSLTATVQ